MTYRVQATIVFAMFICAACSSGGAGTSGTSDTTGTLGGTLKGQSFALKSGAGVVGASGALDLLFSDKAGLCDSLKQGKFYPGEAVVQAYGLTGKAPGKFTSLHNDTKYLRVKQTCASGAPVEGNADATADGLTPDISISSLTPTAVEGTFNLTFKDGSKVSGTFNVPICSNGPVESSSCF